jgi:hypothetical protein
MIKRIVLTAIVLFFPVLIWCQDTELPAPARESSKPLTLLIFLHPDCPVCQKYMNTLNKIYGQYKSSVDIKGYVPGKIKKDEIIRFIEDYRIGFPVSADKNLRLANKLGATTTPEVFLMDDGKVCYRGAIDNWFFELGRYRQEPTQNYLVDAIIASLKGEPSVHSNTKPIGCIIQGVKQNKE